MIEHIILLSKARNKRIVTLAERAGYQCENEFIQAMIEQLADCKEMPELLAKEIQNEF